MAEYTNQAYAYFYNRKNEDDVSDHDGMRRKVQETFGETS